MSQYQDGDPEKARLREDGVDSMIAAGLSIGLGVPEIRDMLANYGWDRTAETVRKRVAEVRAAEAG